MKRRYQDYEDNEFYHRHVKKQWNNLCHKFSFRLFLKRKEAGPLSFDQQPVIAGLRHSIKDDLSTLIQNLLIT